MNLVGYLACEEDLRLAHYYLSLYRGILESQRLTYMKRYEDSGREFINELAKAKHVQCDINTIDDWLERSKAFALKEGQEVTHLNPDYSHKTILRFRDEDLEPATRITKGESGK